MKNTVISSHAKWLQQKVGMKMVPLVVVMSVASLAYSAAYTKSVYSPEKVNNSTIEGWADLSRDCSGTYGCYNYIKIERKRFLWTEWINGGWANNDGWNSIQAALPNGSWEYRTTVDSYNDVTGSYGGGVNVGQVGFTANGTKIYRYRTTWSSGWKWHTR
jgi:hypothetical protein